MTVTDLWSDLSKVEIADLRARNLVRYQRRWRGPDAKTGKPKQFKEGYKEAQKVQAYLDDANQMGNPKAQSIRSSSLTVATLLDRHLAAKTDRAPKTVEADTHHASIVRQSFGGRHVSTLDTTEIEVWSQRTEVARSSRKKQLEILRASIKRGMRDKLVDSDPTDGLVVSLGHHELPYYSSDELMTIVNSTTDAFDKTLLLVLGLMGLRSGEARSLKVGDLANGELTVKNSGSGTDTTKTRSGRRVLPVPAAVLPWLIKRAGDRKKSEWMFPGPRKPEQAIGKGYVSATLTRGIVAANADGERKEKIPRITVHGLRHTFAAIALSEAGADLLSLSKALGHAKPSITLNEYGHLAPAGLSPLMAKIDDVVSPYAVAA